jgi:hypothetical protein
MARSKVLSFKVKACSRWRKLFGPAMVNCSLEAPVPIRYPVSVTYPRFLTHPCFEMTMMENLSHGTTCVLSRVAKELVSLPCLWVVQYSSH